MHKLVEIEPKRAQFNVVSDLSFTQVDTWFNHTRKDLKLNLIYAESMPKLPCLIWICGGGFEMVDKNAHLAYLSKLALQGNFAIASIEYRLANEAKMPAALEDVKAAIRFLRSQSDRFNLDPKKFGIFGESAGGYLSLLAALNHDKNLEVGNNLEYSSDVQAVFAWYPVCDIFDEYFEKTGDNFLQEWTGFPSKSPALYDLNPINLAEKENNFVPILLIHGNKDTLVPFSQSKRLYDILESKGADVDLCEVEKAGHADIRFFQEPLLDLMLEFFTKKL